MKIRAVNVNALIYVINAAAFNAIKYFNAINATFFFLCIYLDRTLRYDRKRGGERIGKLHQARLEPVSPRAM